MADPAPSSTDPGVPGPPLPAVVRRAGDHRWVVIAAPSGYGTTTAAQALAALDPTAIVAEDLHLHDDDGEQAALRLADEVDGGRRAVLTTQGPLPPSLARRVADGTAALVGPTDLLLDAAACARLLAARGATPADPNATGAVLASRSGGWAVAAAILARLAPGADDTASTVVAGVLDAAVDRALDELAPADRSTLVALTRAVDPDDGGVDHALLELDPSGSALRSFARRHPALVAAKPDGLRIGHLLVRRAARTPLDPVVGRHVVDGLTATGAAEDALRLLAQLPDSTDDVQARLADVGPGWIDGGRYRAVRAVVATVPTAARRTATRVLDAAARLGEADLMADPTAVTDGLDEELVDLAGAAAGAGDALAVAGLRVELLRRRGDPRLVTVALDHLGLIGDVGPGTTATRLVDGRSRLAVLGAVQLLGGLGSAAQFSGDPDMVAEGRRLTDLAFDAADLAGLDSLPLRAQAAYDRMVIGVDRADVALAPLEAGIAALAARRHPRTANQLIQSADVHLRLGDLLAATDAAAAAARWAEDTGNDQVRPSIRLVEAAVDLVREGPSPEVDAELEASWSELAAGSRLRRAAPGFALRAANLMLDHDDTARARRWIDRARAVLGERVQLGYQTELLTTLEARRAFLAGEPSDYATVDPDRFAAQPAGQLEYRLTVAADVRRREDAGSAGTPPEAAPARLRVEVLRPDMVVRRDGLAIEPPRGQAARLLALLVLHDGAQPIDAVIEALWPETDPAAGRNRLHQLLLRLRRALGVDADGPIRVVDQVVRLDATRITSDAADLRTARPDDPAAARAAVDGYVGDLLSAQLAYDDLVDDARWTLRRRVVDLARALERDPGDEAGAAAARALWLRLGDTD